MLGLFIFIIVFAVFLAFGAKGLLRYLAAVASGFWHGNALERIVMIICFLFMLVGFGLMELGRELGYAYSFVFGGGLIAYMIAGHSYKRHMKKERNKHIEMQRQEERQIQLDEQEEQALLRELEGREKKG